MKKVSSSIHVELSMRWFVSGIMFLSLVGCGQTTTEPATTPTSGLSNEADSAVVKQNLESEPVANSAASAAPFPKMESNKAVVNVPAFLDDALNGKLESVRSALESGVDVNATDQQQRTAQLFAAFNSHTPVAKLLLDNGAALEHRDTAGRTALMFAASGANAATVELLLESGAGIDAVDKDEKFTALMHAAAEGQVKVVEVLLKHNADISMKDVDGETARDFAVNNGHTEVVRLLSK